MKVFECFYTQQPESVIIDDNLEMIIDKDHSLPEGDSDGDDDDEDDKVTVLTVVDCAVYDVSVSVQQCRLHKISSNREAEIPNNDIMKLGKPFGRGRSQALSFN